MSYQKLIDVSHHNGSINWKKVKAAGYNYVIIRAGYGAGNKDKKFDANIKGAIAAGLSVGIYWFSYAYSVSMAKNEAAQCYKLIKNYKITLPIFFDWEYDSEKYAKQHKVKITKTLFTNMTKAFCGYMEDKGYDAGYYYNPDYYRRGLVSTTSLKDYYRWVAHYASKTDLPCELWQYSEYGKVSGIPSKTVDMNYILNTNILKKVPKKKTETKVNPYTKTDFIKDLQKIFKLPITGKANTALLNKTVTISASTNRTHAAVRPIQKYLYSLGYTEIGTADGEAGSKFTKGIKNYQKKVVKLSAPDGVLSAKNKTWKKLLGL